MNVDAGRAEESSVSTAPNAARLLLALQSAQVVLQSIELPLPQLAVFLDIVGDLLEGRRRLRALVLGFDNVLRALESAKPPKLLLEAFDGAADGKRKLYAAAHRMELKCVVIESLTSAELGLALGRENVIHAAVQPGGLAERLTFDAERLSGFRPSSRPGTERDS